MATVVRRNERSWAIDLISKINLIAKNKEQNYNCRKFTGKCV